MNTQIQAWLDQLAAPRMETIQRYGWSIQYVGGGGCCVPSCGCDDEGPAFAYTIGLAGLGHPELLDFGVDPATAGMVLNELGGRISETLLPGQMIELEERPRRIVPEEVPNPGEIVFGANSFHERPDSASVPVLQLTYEDVAGRLPWDDVCCVAERQPRPGTFRA